MWNGVFYLYFQRNCILPRIQFCGRCCLLVLSLWKCLAQSITSSLKPSSRISYLLINHIYLHIYLLFVYGLILWPSAWLCFGSVPHRVSHDSAGFTGSSLLEWQPAGVCSPISVWSAQPHWALPVQVSPSASVLILTCMLSLTVLPLSHW